MQQQAGQGLVDAGGRAAGAVARSTGGALRRIGLTRVDPAIIVAVLWLTLVAILLAIGGVPTSLIVGFGLLGLIGPIAVVVAGVLVRRRAEPDGAAPTNGAGRIILPSSVASPRGGRRM
ncbi:MAG: hypothetical protein AB7V62_00580 [Thermoleophilia bacterium]